MNIILQFLQCCNVNLFQNNPVGSNEFPSNSYQIVAKHPISGCNTVNHKTASMCFVSMPQVLKTVSPINTGDGIMENFYVVILCSDSYKSHHM